ncbi:DNA-binding transcriptional LysR family regulator [Robbsia andropogonis]|nr:LysR substrate-binding domain-containing protein [Robbsia andropogonis]MCP1118519.1 LysR substrate-binding domain-containing protein [Robbsia andropogonis]MCP1127986.1 LysR substrate-binding domain-containing protein [Robbsia andropogonis]
MLELESTIGSLVSLSEQRSISVSTTVAFAALWLIPRLGGFRMRYPGIDVRVSATNEVQDMKRQRLHLSVRYAQPHMHLPDERLLFEERVVAVCSPSLRTRDNREIRTCADLEQQVLLHLDGACSEWPWYSWDHLLEELGEPRIRPAGALHLSQFDQLIQAAVDGHGIALGRRPLINRLINQGRLVELFPEHSISSGAYYLVTDNDPDDDSDVTKLIDWIREEVRSSV